MHRCFAGLAAHENKLYFNSDKAIYCYNVISETLTKIKDEIGICGLFVEEDELEYCRRDSSGRFVEAGEIHISDTRIAVRLDKNNKLVVSTINETDNPIMLYCFDGETCQAHTI